MQRADLEASFLRWPSHEAFPIKIAGRAHDELGCRRAPESNGRMFPIHHVLPQSLARHPVINFLANRFNIDGIRNRMALPATQELADDLKSSPHSGGHLG